MPLEGCWLVDAVIRGAGLFGNSSTDDVGQLFEATTVVGHDAERAPQFTNLFDFWMLEEFTERHVIEPLDFALRDMNTAMARTPIMIPARLQLPMSCSSVANLD